jgi:hypothetical protein
MELNTRIIDNRSAANRAENDSEECCLSKIKFSVSHSIFKVMHYGYERGKRKISPLGCDMARIDMYPNSMT